MFQMEVIQDLLVNRKDVFDSIPILAASGLSPAALSEDTSFALQVCANSPSFKSPMPTTHDEKLDMGLVSHGGKFSLPFDQFSIVYDHHRGGATLRLVMVVARIAPEDYREYPDVLDTVMLLIFADRLHKGWELMFPLRLSLIGQVSEYRLEWALPFAKGFSEDTFAKNYNKTAGTDRYMIRVKDLIEMLSLFLRDLRTMKDISFRPANTQPRSLLAAAKSKKDFWDYHTVQLGVKSSPVPYQGGTHASPRQHERRGHWRHYASGKTVFVESMTVGRIENGMIVKDYNVKEPENAQASVHCPA